MDYGGPVTEHKTWQEVCPDSTWKEMFDVTGVDYKWVLSELEAIPPAVLNICAGLDSEHLTPFVEISNLVTPVDLETTQDFAELEAEYREELEKYGTVKEVVICPKGTSREGRCTYSTRRRRRWRRRGGRLMRCGAACSTIGCWESDSTRSSSGS